MTPAATATTIPPVDALDPIATPEPGDCPLFDALTAEHAPRPRDARGRFCKEGQQ